eukprot:941395-Pyramimonas_sp.AAC.1
MGERTSDLDKLLFACKIALSASSLCDLHTKLDTTTQTSMPPGTSEKHIQVRVFSAFAFRSRNSPNRSQADTTISSRVELN